MSIESDHYYHGPCPIKYGTIKVSPCLQSTSTNQRRELCSPSSSSSSSHKRLNLQCTIKGIITVSFLYHGLLFNIFVTCMKRIACISVFHRGKSTCKCFFLYEIVQPCIFQWLISMFYKLKNWKTFRGLKYSVYLEINELNSMCRNEPQTLLCWFLYLFSQMFWDHFDTLIEIYDLRWCLFIVCRSLNWQFNNQRVRQRN